MVTKQQKKQYGLGKVQKPVFSEHFTLKNTKTCDSMKIEKKIHYFLGVLKGNKLYVQGI